MRHGQATIELLVLLLLAVALTVVMAVATGADGGSLRQHLVESIPGHRPVRRDDRWALRSDPYGSLIRRWAPTLVLERDRYGEDAAVPSDPGVCRKPWCAAYGTGRPVSFTHLVRRPWATYIEYWFYYPDSKTLHLPLAQLQGYHRDDWEGMIVRIPVAGQPGARLTVHQGLVGTMPGWLQAPGWRVIGEHPIIYRAAGSHANGFGRNGIDMPFDRWNGDLGRIDWSTLTLIAADTAPALRLRYDEAALPPWWKALWHDPEATGTGR
jgi:hypothetical protein